MPACKVDPEGCPQFRKLRDHWRKHGYPKIDDALAEAFKNISKDICANGGREVPRFSAVLSGRKLYKYRQKDKAAREGARGGWRIYALYDQQQNTLYPALVYPKKELSDADDDTIITAIKEIVQILTSMFSN